VSRDGESSRPAGTVWQRAQLTCRWKPGRTLNIKHSCTSLKLHFQEEVLLRRPLMSQETEHILRQSVNAVDQRRTRLIWLLSIAGLTVGVFGPPDFKL
jgi:hypothetical protein